MTGDNGAGTTIIKFYALAKWMSEQSAWSNMSTIKVGIIMTISNGGREGLFLQFVILD